MYLHKLSLTNVRAFRAAEFDFLGKEGVHLIVGVNGVGKSTVLEALRIALSQLVPQFVTTKVRGFDFNRDDITQNEPYLGMLLTGEVLFHSFRYTIDRKADAHVPEAGPVQGGQGPQVINTPDFTNIYLDSPYGPELKEAGVDEQGIRLKEVQQHPRSGLSWPLAVYYSPHRSLITNEAAKISRTQLPAYVEALSPERTFSIKAFADWWRFREVLAAEKEGSTIEGGLNAVFNQVVDTFLTRCKDLRLAPVDDDRQLLITKNGYELSIRQLSDGERSIITLALDLARRLYLANPQLDDPLRKGQAIVLIDELDLHLHPGWQRDVVKRLETTFQQCQFICSTHSPQIIGEVPHKQVSLLQVQEPQVVHPSQTFGMDANWIIDVLMDAKPRNERVTLAIKKLFSLIAPATLPEAKALLENLRDEIGLGSSELSRAEASINRLERINRETN